MLKFGLHKRLHKFTCNNIVGISKQIVKESHTLSYCIFFSKHLHISMLYTVIYNTCGGLKMILLSETRKPVKCATWNTKLLKYERKTKFSAC